ncbi:hypothetical protein [Streptomyces sp. NBC_01205]|uniref:hypothetical protein n=1 Tax=Streptomyces sp. NBC_01205 TaxID=2903771 RepID=UPI002E10B5F8|nr:MSCRAMM family adhesin SdrC [Streptomyces sp. NBC_01205]
MNTIQRRQISTYIGATCLAATLSFSTGAAIATAAHQAPAMAMQDDSGSDQSGTDTNGSDTGNQQDSSHPQGTDTGNQQDSSHPQGTDTGNQQDSSHPQGTDTGNQQDSSHPQGTDTGNQQDSSHPQGTDTGNQQDSSHPQGTDTGNQQDSSHPQGTDTGNQQDSSHPQGTDTGNQQDSSHPQGTDTGNQQDSSHPQGTDTGNQRTNTGKLKDSDTQQQPGTTSTGKSEAQRACEEANRPWVDQDGGFCGQFGSITGSPNKETEGQRKEREIAEKALVTIECVKSAATAAFFAVHPELRGVGIVVSGLTVGSRVTAAGTDLESGKAEEAAWKIAEIIPTVTKGKVESPGATGAVVKCAKVVLELTK